MVQNYSGLKAEIFKCSFDALCLEKLTNPASSNAFFKVSKE